MNSTLAIIPTTGALELEQAIASVLTQDEPTDVLVAFDGKQYERVLRLPDDPRVTTITLPYNTGRGRTHLLPEPLPKHWYGARVQVACAFMVNHDFCFVLDQDNWVEPRHVSSCLRLLKTPRTPPLGFVFAMRNIYRKDGSFVCRDECESVGASGGVSGPLIDTSCYFYRTDFLLQTAHHWLWGWGSDRVYLDRVRRQFGDRVFAPTGDYTVNYRLGGNPGSVREELFHAGNPTRRPSPGMPSSDLASVRVPSF